MSKIRLELRLSKVEQARSGGSYVAKYEAVVEAEAGAGNVEVRVVSTVPDLPDEYLLQETIQSIQSGVKAVFLERELDGVVTLHRLFIHDVDCKPSHYERFTRQILEEAMQNN